MSAQSKEKVAQIAAETKLETSSEQSSEKILSTMLVNAKREEKKGNGK